MTKYLVLAILLFCIIFYIIEISSSNISYIIKISNNITDINDYDMKICNHDIVIDKYSVIGNTDCNVEGSVSLFYKDELLGGCGYFDGGNYKVNINIEHFNDKFNESNCNIIKK